MLSSAVLRVRSGLTTDAARPGKGAAEFVGVGRCLIQPHPLRRHAQAPECVTQVLKVLQLIKGSRGTEMRTLCRYSSPQLWLHEPVQPLSGWQPAPRHSTHPLGIPP